MCFQKFKNPSSEEQRSDTAGLFCLEREKRREELPTPASTRAHPHAVSEDSTSNNGELTTLSSRIPTRPLTEGISWQLG